MKEAERLRSADEKLRAEGRVERQQPPAESQRLAQKLSAQQEELAREVMQIRADEKRLREEMAHAFRTSASWRITAPLRAATKALRTLSGRSPSPGGAVETPAPEGGATPPAAADANAKAAMRAAFRTQLDVFLTASGKLRLPAHPAPDVSILLVLYNQAELTFACLSSIAEVTNGSRLGVEVIILDNGSSDATALLLHRIEGARIIRSPENLHFVRGANRAARDGRGKYLLFLNNDALLMPGALETAVRDSEADASVGAIGGRIVLPDGTLQEAGSVVWNDGICLGYGRGERPDAPEFMYRRDVDYCSAAFLLTPRALFESLGGFDERYAPAYYEEADYCVRIWESGRRVVFDPGIVILHYEFGSSSTAAHALELQQRNQATFRERHAAWLEGQHADAPSNLLRARARTSAKRVLFIEDRVPHAKLGAGFPRSNELLRELVAGGAEVTLFLMFSLAETWEGIRRSVPESVEVMYGLSEENLRAFLERRRGFYDAVFVCRPHNMKDFLAATQGRPELVGDAHVFYDAEALFASRKLQQRALAGEEISSTVADRMIADEVALTRTAHAIVSVSSQEKAQFEAHGVGPVFVLGHAIAVAPTVTPFKERTDLLFVGAVHGEEAPNAESLRWFAGDIWPLLKRELGQDIQLTVVGINLAPSITALAGHGLELIGAVDDLRPWFERARVVLAPTRIAAGIPLKVYEAAAHGVPTVATDLLAAQTGWQSGRDLLAATSASDFASATARLYRDEPLWHAIRASALERVTADCSRVQFRNTVRQLLATVPDRTAPAPRAVAHPPPAASNPVIPERVPEPTSQYRVAYRRAQRVLDRLRRDPSFARRYAADAFRVFRQSGVKGVLHYALRERSIERAPDPYAEWVASFDTLSAADLAAIDAHTRRFKAQPLMSLLVPIHDTPEPFLRKCIDSVIGQTYANWELCLADDGSSSPHVAKVCSQYAKADTRIKFMRRATKGHISAATNSALSMATGDFVALLDSDDELAVHALYMVAAELDADPDLDFLFSDEDKIDEDGLRFDPWFKPDWNYDLMLSQNAVVHLAVYRRAILQDIGGFRTRFDGSQDYDVTLRFSERTTPDRIRHIPHILYHWRAIPGSGALAPTAKIYSYEAAARAIQEHLDRTGRDAVVSMGPHLGHYRVTWALPEERPRVTLIIPTQDRVDLLRVAVQSILDKTRYENFDVLVVNNRSEQPESFSYFEEISRLPRVRVIAYDKPYSFAALNNWAAGQTDAPLLAFVNNDVEVIEPDWLSEMVGHALRAEVGAVGAKLFYPNGTIQHAGVVVGIGRLTGHPHVGLPRDAPGYFGRAVCTQQFSAVTGACMVMRREVFLEMHGFDEEHFAVAFNDVDIGLRLRKAKYAIVWTPHAELFHHESASLGPAFGDKRRDQFLEECGNFRRIWADVIADDPFYNPNLTITGGDFSPAVPPRAARPWRHSDPASAARPSRGSS